MVCSTFFFFPFLSSSFESKLEREHKNGLTFRREIQSGCLAYKMIMCDQKMTSQNENNLDPAKPTMKGFFLVASCSRVRFSPLETYS